MNRNDVLTDPKKLVRVELRNAGFDIDKIKIPDRVYLLADDIFDEMLSRNVGEYRYPLGGKLYVFNENIGFIKGHMCSPTIANQEEDLIAAGQVMDYREKGALCVEMEGVGLFTVANYRNCKATGIYVVSDVYAEDDWKLGWEGSDIGRAVSSVINMIIESTK